MRRRFFSLFSIAASILVAFTIGTFPASAADYDYLSEPCDPYYVGKDFPKLTTPQWFGEPGVDAVVVLAIDDMRDPAVYERFLRPIIDRVRQIDPRGGLSIMTNEVEPDDPQLQTWLDEGVSLEVHTLAHPCPCLQKGDFDAAAATYHNCVDLMAEIPGNEPTAYRMPCCDSMNSPSPRFWMEIFNRTSRRGNFLRIDSSVFHVFNADDPALPAAITHDDQGRPRFSKYVGFNSFVNYVENYPYPYVIGRRGWQFPCMAPSDWEAQNFHQPNNPATVIDLQAALDATVIKQGVMNVVFHPHGWIRHQQMVELVDYAAEKYGRRVRFVSFHAAAERLSQFLLAGSALRNAEGNDGGVRLLDLNDDGYLDVVIGNEERRLTRIWEPETSRWANVDFPCAVTRNVDGKTDTAAKFGQLRLKGHDSSATPIVVHVGADALKGWRFSEASWVADPTLVRGLRNFNASGRVVLRDVDNDGNSEALVDEGESSRVYRWQADRRAWRALPFGLPAGARLPADYDDTGLRLIDVDGDGADDVLFSNDWGYGLHLWEDNDGGWSRNIRAGRRGEEGAIRPLAHRGQNLGAWFRDSTLWFQNEQTDALPAVVDRISFDELLIADRGAEPESDDGWISVGTARIEITPELPIRLHGYAGRPHEATEVAQPLWARALAISGADGADPAVLIAVELLGVTEEITAEVVRRLEQRAGISPKRVAIAATHTHNGPLVRGLAPNIFGQDVPRYQQQRIDRYTEKLIDQLTETALDALQNRGPAKLRWSTGRLTFAANRRTAGGPVDHRLPVLAARDKQNRVVAILATYACHCTTLGPEENRIHGDWAGVAAALLEEKFPGATALITIGCGADANPHPRTGMRLAEQHGANLAAEVERIVAGSMKPVRGPLNCRQAVVDLPFDALPSTEEFQARAGDEGAGGYHARKQLARLAAGEPLPRTLPYTVGVWTFGSDLAMVFLAGEVVVDYALRLGNDFDGDRLWVHAYANDVPCYIPSGRIRREGGYEGGGAMIYYDQPTELAAEVEGLIVDTVQRLMPHHYYSKTMLRDFPPPRSPEQSLKMMDLRPGVRIELVAAEPLVVDPVAFDWGPDGRLWVVEMRDYPNGWGEAGPKSGRVVVLEDVDQDGKYDRSGVFADNLPFPTGLKVWRDGLLVTAAPDILWLQDNDGDGVADVREVLYSGFGEGNQQHRVNGLRWGIDNWLHVGNGDSNGVIRSARTGQKVDVSGRDLRIQPDTGALDAESGSTQFGREMNDWGDWFGGNNSNAMWHYVLSDARLRRNPHLMAAAVRRDVPEEPGLARVYPATRTLERFNDLFAANRFTSACSPMIYRDDLLGEEFAGNSFVCEPVHNLVHREVVRQEGLTYRSRRADDEQTSEFLASRDHWFRPVMVRTGPDGALWIADMYRFVIEHPTWIPEDFKRKMDVTAGDQRGRIYRVLPAGGVGRPIPALDEMSTAEMAAALASPNGWVRDMAQQLLVCRKDLSGLAALEKMVAGHAEPCARLHALATLNGLERVSDDLLSLALRDRHPGVRRLALHLCDGRLDDNPKLLEAVVHCATDDDLRVQLAAAYALGETVRPEAALTLADLIVRHHHNEIMLSAALSSLHEENAGAVLEHVMQHAAGKSGVTALVRQVTRQALLLAPARTQEVLKHFFDGGIDALEPGQWLPVAAEISSTVAAGESSPWDDLLARLEEDALSLIPNERIPLAERQLAIDLVSRPRQTESIVYHALAILLDPACPPALQKSAVRGLSRLPDDALTAQSLLQAWPTAGPSVRSEIIDAMTNRTALCERLLAQLEQPDSAVRLSARDRQRLLSHRDETIRQRATMLFGKNESNRQEIIDQYADAARLPPDVEQGKRVFAKHCATCHRLGEDGYALGPDLAALTDASHQALMVAILDPNRAVEDKYGAYGVVTIDGRQLSGMIVEETSTQLTLDAGKDRRVVVLRNEIEQMQASGASLMPEGLEKDLSAQDLADVIAYVRAQRAPPKEYPNNEPRLVRSEDERTVELDASACSIYGSRLVFEQKYRNLGWWVAENDRAVWEAEMPAAATYRVSLDYASPPEAAGNRFLLSIAGQTLPGVVKSTGSWDHYDRFHLGDVDLPAGRTEVTVTSDGPIKNFLFDLRGVRLQRAEIEDSEPAGAPWKRHVVDDSSRGADGVKLADINGDGVVDIATGWEEGGVTRVYLSPGPEKSKSRWPMVTVGKTPSVEDAVFVDLDGDGRHDVVSCCEGKTKKIFVHWAPKATHDLLDPDKWKQDVLVDSEVHAQQWMFAWPMQVDGKHGVDLIAGSKGENAHIGWFEAPENGRDLSGYRWHPISPAGWTMSIWKRDMDGDLDLDLVVSDRFGSLRGCRWLENPGYGPAQRQPWTSHMMGGEGEEVLSMDIADLDGDGLDDAVVAVRDMKILFLKRMDESGLRWESHEISADFQAGNTRAVAAADLSGDGQLDLAITTWNARSKHGVFWLEHLTQEPRWIARQISGPDSGIKFDRIEMLDLDGDGDLDLLTCEEQEAGAGLGVLWYENPSASGPRE